MLAILSLLRDLGVIISKIRYAGAAGVRQCDVHDYVVVVTVQCLILCN